jgi:hypothetical protein
MCTQLYGECILCGCKLARDAAHPTALYIKGYDFQPEKLGYACLDCMAKIAERVRIAEEADTARN